MQIKIFLDSPKDILGLQLQDWIQSQPAHLKGSIARARRGERASLGYRGKNMSIQGRLQFSKGHLATAKKEVSHGRAGTADGTAMRPICVFS